MPPQIVFLCGARDYHAFDWYRSSLKLKIYPPPIIVTDLIQAEGFTRLIEPSDLVYNLFILDPLLFPFQGALSNVWRNFLKLLFFPLQVFLLHLFAKKHPGSIYYAHSMYYICLASVARLAFVGTPQGSEILVRAKKSVIYRFICTLAMRTASLITVDSEDMANAIQNFSRVNPLIVQNGIDTGSIAMITSNFSFKNKNHIPRILSLRGLTPLYQIDQIILARNSSCRFHDVGIDIVYPFYDASYSASTLIHLKPLDRVHGRVSSTNLYQLCANSLLCVSIPFSDSSPRSVYEAIFCGCIVAVSWHGYVNCLPDSMRSRLFVVDLSSPMWLDDAISFALSQQSVPFEPCKEALLKYDQLQSFLTLYRRSLSSI
jgi:hypothetical protein